MRRPFDRLTAPNTTLGIGGSLLFCFGSYFTAPSLALMMASAAS